MKLKICKSALKRIKIKKKGFFRKSAYKGHLLRKKNSNKLRRLSKKILIKNSDNLNFFKMLFS